MANLVRKMSRYFALERSQVVGKWENRDRKRVPEFTSERDEGVKILVNSCISEVDRIGMRVRGKTCAAGPREGGRQAGSQFMRRA